MLKLQSLRIPTGWEVVFNKFLEIDIEDLLLRYCSDYNIDVDVKRYLKNE